MQFPPGLQLGAFLEVKVDLEALCASTSTLKKIVVKESVETKEVTNLRRVSGKEMLADCLTKKGASSNRLMDVLEKGQMRL